METFKRAHAAKRLGTNHVEGQNLCLTLSFKGRTHVNWNSGLGSCNNHTLHLILTHRLDGFKDS